MPRARRPAAPPAPARSPCPIASSLDLLGDKWSLLVLRDALCFGKSRFAQFLASGEGISTNLLTERLTRLTRAGLLERRLYERKPARHEYLPTEMARDLLPVLVELIRWGNRHVPGTFAPDPEALARLRRRD